MKDLYADIIVDISQEKLDKTFQYLVPKEMEPEIEEGKKVRIPLWKGGQRDYRLCGGPFFRTQNRGGADKAYIGCRRAGNGD